MVDGFELQSISYFHVFDIIYDIIFDTLYNIVFLSFPDSLKKFNNLTERNYYYIKYYYILTLLFKIQGLPRDKPIRFKEQISKKKKKE